MATRNDDPGVAEPDRQTTYEVRVWSVRRFTGRRSCTYRVRWAVAGHETGRTFPTRALADRFRSDLIAATNRGELFDVSTRLPVSMLTRDQPTSWWDWALAYTDLRWPELAPNSRLSLAEALTTVTMALLATDRGRPDPGDLRQAMMQWAFIPPRRRSGPPPGRLAPAVGWLLRNTVTVTALQNPATTRRVLDALARKLDGDRAAATTIARKRAVLFNALELAAERELLTHNPLRRLRWTAPKAVDAIDPACVVNPDQARALLAAVAQVGASTDPDQVPAPSKVGRTEPKGDRLVAFFACIYYCGTRPSEALAIRVSDLDLPSEDGQWGMLRLSRNDPEITTAWTDNGRREARQLKHRAKGAVRPVPCPPDLVRLLRAHTDAYGVGLDGKLFRGTRGGAIKESLYTEVWQAARRRVLTPAQAASPLAARPYDLRHSCVSTWLAAGVDSAQIATWVGHSVAVLHRVYAHVLPGRDEIARRRIEAILRPPGQPT
jgi:integrase